MKKEYTENNGITLIALVITIVVTLILAGVTMAALTGENGVISNAHEAKIQSEIQQEKEILQQAINIAIGKNKRGNLEAGKLQTVLNSHVGDKKTEVTENLDKTLNVEFFDTKNYYKVTDKIIEKSIKTSSGKIIINYTLEDPKLNGFYGERK